MLLDPALFTAPYDAALSRGLASAGVAATWITRPLRDGEEVALAPAAMRPLFYRWTDGPRRRTDRLGRLAKGVEHALGLAATVREAARTRPDIVHLQWAVLPPFDRIAVDRLRAHAPVVMTVHDTTPFNGKDVPAMQRRGFARVLAAADRLIVHTAGARDQLVAGGHDAARIDVVAHGLLTPAAGTPRRPGPRWRIVQFGRIQHYKGVDLLVEALGTLPPEVRARIEVVVAGEAQLDTAPLVARAAALGLTDTIDFRFGFLSERETGALLGSADAFVFPYRMIEASGVLHLVAGLGRWVIASDVGAFPALLGRDGQAGRLVDPTDSAALGRALADSIDRVPARSIGAHVPDWDAIGEETRKVYALARQSWAAARG